MEWSAKVESAPRMREWRLPVILRARMLNVSPAYAGVEGSPPPAPEETSGQPRARGGRGTNMAVLGKVGSSAPGMRG